MVFGFNLNSMFKKEISNGVVHKIPKDLEKVIFSNKSALVRWNSITPLARNEWICWSISNKKEETRINHIKRTVIELLEGKRRPCCWAGCIHR